MEKLLKNLMEVRIKMAKNVFKIKGKDKNPVILSKVKNSYRVSYFEKDKVKTKDFEDRSQAEIYANKKAKITYS